MTSLLSSGQVGGGQWSQLSKVMCYAGYKKKHQYWETLERLIQTKIDLAFEHSTQGDFNELRDDMKNMIIEEFKKRDKQA